MSFAGPAAMEREEAILKLRLLEDSDLRRSQIRIW